MGTPDGQANNRQNPAEQLRRYGLLLCHEEEHADMTEKFSIKKYDPVLRKHVEFKEGKIK